MPQQYRPNLKGKGWVHEADNGAEKERMDDVWEMQKKALLDCTTPGRHTWSGYKQAVVHLPSSASSSSTRPQVHPIPHCQ